MARSLHASPSLVRRRTWPPRVPAITCSSSPPGNVQERIKSSGCPGNGTDLKLSPPSVDSNSAASAPRSPPQDKPGIKDLNRLIDLIDNSMIDPFFCSNKKLG